MSSTELPDQVRRHQFSHDTPILDQNEYRTKIVVVITILTMVVELSVGWYSRSMALMADGWHMATHAGALALTLFGYWFAKKYDSDPRFSFGTGKVFALTGFSSAIVLALAGVMVAIESIHHLLSPEKINFSIAIIVAALGLVVNLICALILAKDQASEQNSGQNHGHSHGHAHDHNLRGAYLHVLADALTSVLAIVALALGKWLGWVILDPIIGIVGGIVILRWAIALCKETTWVLLDAQDSTDLMDAITECVTKEGETWIVDLHIWDLGLGRRACVLSVVSLNPMTPDEYKAQLAELASFFHINVEVFAYSDSDPKYRLSFPEQGDSHDHGHSHYQEDGD